MENQLKICAPAKINLFLEVTGRRADGYHLLDTVMQTVGLFDELTLDYRPEGEGIRLTCQKKYIPTDETNVAYRAAERFLRQANRKGGLDLHLKKHIPVAAGLGGGSADAAAVFLGLNRMFDDPFSLSELCALGTELGADIPFCIRKGCVRATGIGEVFEDSSPLSDLVPVIAIGSKGSSTPAAYKALDSIGYCGSESALPLCKALSQGDRREICRLLFNAFEEVIFPQNSDAAFLKKELLRLGAWGALMSGSGASVYGLFPELPQARRACASLRKQGFFAVVAPALS